MPSKVLLQLTFCKRHTMENARNYFFLKVHTGRHCLKYFKTYNSALHRATAMSCSKECSHVTKFSPIFSFLISARYSVQHCVNAYRAEWTHSARYSARHHWHNVKLNIGPILKMKKSGWISLRVNSLWRVLREFRVKEILRFHSVQMHP